MGIKLLLSVFFLLSSFYLNATIPKDTLVEVEKRGSLLWGADAEGGAPYIFQDPKDPTKLIGFEVDLAEAIARELGVKAVQVQLAWDNLIPGLDRGDFDIAMNGLEITEERKSGVLFSAPYYIYTEQLVVRKNEVAINSFLDLKHKKVGTLSGAVSQDMLNNLGDVDVRLYSDQAAPYEDLALNRLDAVFMDLPIAAYYARPNPKLKYLGEPLGEGFYGIAYRKGDSALKNKIDEALLHLFETGELKKIYEKWGLWNKAQEKLKTELQKIDISQGEKAFDDGKLVSVFSFMPFLLKSAWVTIYLSITAMVLAVSLGLVLTMLRLYGSSPFKQMAYAYVEIYRGTPLLIQLYILYYGLPNIGISLSPVVAAIIGLGMNYAAYEAELYRAGISSIPKGQVEASSALGMSRLLCFKKILLPQALRVTLPGITNDFIALLKDSSLVSVIAMVELTKTYSMLASSSLKYFQLGIIVAILYFVMSYPFSLLARYFEKRLSKGVRK